MKQDLIHYLNNIILKQASKLRYEARELAPSTESELFAYRGSQLVVWSGASDNTIFQDETVNWAFRALHDALHIKTQYNFTPDAEIALGRLQASQYSGIIADIVYCEVAGQAEYYKKNGVFVTDQVGFTNDFLKKAV